MIKLLLSTTTYIAFSTVGFLLGYIFRGSVQRWRDAEEQEKQYNHLRRQERDRAFKAVGEVD